jgi:hypothetical protein
VVPPMPSAASSAARSLSKVPLRASAQRETCDVGSGTAGGAVAARGERGRGIERDEPGVGVSGGSGVSVVVRRVADASSEAGDALRAGTGV